MEKKIVILLIFSLMMASVISAENIQQAQYTWESSSIYDPPDQKMPIQKVWRKGEKVRKEWEQDKVKTIVIIRDGFVYTYYPDSIENSGWKMPITPTNLAALIYSADNPFVYMDSLIKRDAKLIRSEVLRGHLCDVYELKNEIVSENDKVRCWIWRDKNFPVRVETEVKGEIDSWEDYKDIKLGVEIDDKLFDLPEGVEFKEERAYP